MKNKIKGLLALVLVAFTSITWADSTDITEVIAINFGSDKQALNTAAEGDLGFVTADGMLGAQVPLAKWNNVSGPSGTEVTVAGAKTETSYLLTYSSPNTWNSQDGNTYNTSIGNLTKGYLDVSNAGGAVPEISLSGMPTTGYDVAVILSGDGGTFGAVTVNGKDYIGSNGETILGEDSWGTRQSYDTLAEGQNVIFVKEQSAESLTIVGKRTTNTARASIAGLMVFFREIPDARDCTYTVTDEGGSWDVVPSTAEPCAATIAFSETTRKSLDLATILGDVSSLRSLTIEGMNGDTLITVPESGVSVGVLTVNGTGTLTITGGKIIAAEVVANANIVAGTDTLTLAPMEIAGGVTVAYTMTGGDNSEVSLPALTGEGTFSKFGPERLSLENTRDCGPQIIVNAGTLRFKDQVYEKAYDIVAKEGATIQIGTWTGRLTSSDNTLKFDGGATLWLYNGNSTNGSVVNGTITIDSSVETPVIIKGSSFGNNSNIAAAIKGNGVLEIQDNNDNYFTISGVISDGDAEGDVLAVKIVTDRGVTFTGANTYTGGTVIAEGATVSVSNINTIFGTGNVTGAGTVKIAGGTYNGLSLAQYTDANTTIEIPADNTVTGYFNDATWTCAAKIRLDGTLSLTNGFGADRYTFTGPWTGAGSFSLSNANPADAVRITGDISGFTGDISVAGARALTFCAATTGNNQKYAGKICVHGDYAYTAKVNGTWSAPVVVENGAKIGGEGSIANTLTFNAGSIIDGSVAATGDVTLNGTVTVSGEAGATVLTCANAASLDLTKFAAPAGLKCVAEDGAIKLAVANVSFVPATAESMSVEVAAATEDAAMAMVDIQRPEGVGDDVVTAEDYAAYFTKTATGENGTYTVTVSLKDDVKPVVGTTDDADDAFTVDADGVTIAINNYKPGLYYGIRSATELGALKTVETVNVDVKEGKINVAKLTGDSAFYQVVVDVKPFPSVNDGAEGDAPESGPDAE